MLSAHTKISNGTHSEAQDTARARPARRCNNSSTNTAMTWLQPEGVLGPPCLMPTSKLNEALFVNPKHGRARSSKFSLTVAAAEMVVAHLSRSTSPNTWALTESNALATSMETMNNFSPHSSALREDDVKTLHARPEPHQLAGKRSEFFVQDLPHAHCIHFVQ